MPQSVIEAWAFARAYVDASWVDVLSLIGGLAYAHLQRRRCGSLHPWVSKNTGMDVANGVSLVPLALLAVGGLSNKVLTELLQANRLTLAVAGIFALLAILERPSPRP